MTKKALEDQAKLTASVGTLGIYKEKTFIRLVHVNDLAVDNWGVRFSFRVEEAPGFENEGDSTFEASGTWQYLAVSDRSISAAYAGWFLVVRSDLVDQIRAT